MAELVKVPSPSNSLGWEKNKEKTWGQLKLLAPQRSQEVEQRGGGD